MSKTLVERGEIRNGGQAVKRCPGCKHSRPSDGLSFLHCSKHKCSVNGNETCPHFEKRP